MNSSLRPIVGVDIGGANLKFAHHNGGARSCAFPMWRQPDRLADSIVAALADTTGRQALAVTMTGEMADCFPDRVAGVKHIIQHSQTAAKDLGINDVAYYGVDGVFRTGEEAKAAADLLASANWHALGNFVGAEIAADALLLDVGTTTTDVIKIRDGQVAGSDRTDHDRLRSKSLVYVGCKRTPVCALVNRLPLDGHDVPVMNEVFATIDDALLVLSRVSESGDTDTADGKPRTVPHAISRLARMIGLDGDDVSLRQATVMASAVVAAAKRMIRQAMIDYQYDVPVVLSGHGQGLVEFDREVTVIALQEQLGAELSRCAPAYAVARLLGGKTHSHSS